VKKTKPNASAKAQNVVYEAKDGAMSKYIASMKYMEAKYFCSGICKQPIFWYTKPINSLPLYGCLSHMVNEIEGKLSPIGTVATCSGVVMLLIWIFQYFLWCDYKDEYIGD